MNPGELKHRITIQQLENVQNTFGEQKAGWIDVTTRWASIEPLIGRQYFAAEMVNSEITHKIKLRYVKGILPSMQVLYKTRKFQIISVINYQEKNCELQLMCKELI